MQASITDFRILCASDAGWRGCVALERIEWLVNRPDGPHADEYVEQAVWWAKAAARAARIALEQEVEAPVMTCEHCGTEDESVRADRWGNVLCKRCAEREAEAEDRDE